MSTLLWLFSWLVGLIIIAYNRASLITATVAIGVGLVITTFFSGLSWGSSFALWALFVGGAFVLNHSDYRRRYLIHPAFKAMQQALPTMSETEKTAIEAGTISWDGELFTGNPQWEKLLTIPAPHLSEEEQAYLDGPVKKLCEMIDDWQITQHHYDLPPHVWDYLKTQGFFGLIIPKKYQGKGFSEYAHSEILATLAGRSLTLSSIVAVPNSLGPAELILRYGSQEQRDYYLPRLAKGLEIPCFALTAPEAGSDAGAISDTGVICKSHFEGQETIGIKLNWNKRYITLAPIATLVGLAFKLYDPDHLLGDKKALGITCALIPATTPGVTIGRRHLPSTIPFQNGPTQGKDVFIPLDWIIGGQEMIGQGWRMLVECLSSGRAISLPSTSVGGSKVATLSSSAYSIIRRQFRTTLASFEGIQEVLARIVGFTYLSDAVRKLTVSMVDMGEKPSVLSAIAKYHVTELGRHIANDAMDLHGGKAIMMGPKNYLVRSYQGVPIAITVEGANILTRNMIIFGQGAIRCHPFILKEMEALQHNNFQDFEHFFSEHIRYTLSNGARALFHGLTASCLAHTPVSHSMKRYYQQLARASSAFALVADASMALLGGKLKFKESISARLGDLLSMMFLMSSALKRYQDEGTPVEDLPIVQWSLDYCLEQYWQAMNQLLSNLPNRGIAFGLRVIVMPFGVPRFTSKDSLNHKITQLFTSTSDSRKRLLSGIFISQSDEDSLAVLQKAFEAVVQNQKILKQVLDAVKNNEQAQSLKKAIDLALNAKIITEQEAAELHKVDSLCTAVISVDDFTHEELHSMAKQPTPTQQEGKHEPLTPPISQATSRNMLN